MNLENKVSIVWRDGVKHFTSPDYNYIFRYADGLFARWGKTEDDDPTFSPFGPEILDLECVVNGCPNQCPWCYKDNTVRDPTNMSLKTFETILDKMPPTLCQIAFGITGVKTNPNFLDMMRLSRDRKIVPNFTLSGADADNAFIKESAKLIGAVAVSCYRGHEDRCFSVVQKYIDEGIKQTNIHFMLCTETYILAKNVIRRISDEKVPVNAIVFLGVKPKGRAKRGFTPLHQDLFNNLIKMCDDFEVGYGFDSCSAPKYAKYVQSVNKMDLFKFIEPCESGLFSAYINVFGNYFACSFCEGKYGPDLNVLECNDFVNDIWYHPDTITFREKLLATQDKNGIRKCLPFPEINP